ncbi:MAG TPA: hypothetical protein DCG75_09835 [Bacteroidales bacterium]|nr:hypothetical protein [Bacteroidales bacterium]
MKSILKYSLSFLISFFAANALLAQNNIDHCSDYLTSGFVSDGQEYKAKLDENNRAKFYTTFYGGSQYRLIACGEITDYPLAFSVFDTEKNLLFSNKDNDFTPYWNFTFTSTIDCIIEFEYNNEKPLKNEVMLLIGFKEK